MLSSLLLSLGPCPKDASIHVQGGSSPSAMPFEDVLTASSEVCFHGDSESNKAGDTLSHSRCHAAMLSPVNLAQCSSDFSGQADSPGSS